MSLNYVYKTWTWTTPTLELVFKNELGVWTSFYMTSKLNSSK